MKKKWNGKKWIEWIKKRKRNKTRNSKVKKKIDEEKNKNFKKYFTEKTNHTHTHTTHNTEKEWMGWMDGLGRKVLRWKKIFKKSKLEKMDKKFQFCFERKIIGVDRQLFNDFAMLIEDCIEDSSG